MTKLTRRLFLNTIMVVVVGSAGGCESSCKSGAPDAVELTGDGSHGEMTVGVVPPGKGACSAGRIYIASQNPNLLMRKLINPDNGPYDVAPPATDPLQNLTAFDNQLARLTNGDLLLLWLGGTTAPLSTAAREAQGGINTLPPWWDNWNVIDNQAVLKEKALFPNGRKGYRAALLLWRFSAAECKWSATPIALDAGEVSGSSGQGSSLGYCAQLAPKFAGFDRPELYVDPWGVNPNDSSKQRIYVSTACARCLEPPCPALAGQALDDDNMQVFSSLDSGVTWDSGRRLFAPQPVAMTSTAPNGRLFMFNVNAGDPNGKANIYWADPSGKGFLGSPKGPFDIAYTPVDENGEFIKDPSDPEPDPNKKKPLKLLPNWLPSNVVGVEQPGAPPLTLARAGDNSTLAVYPAIEFAAGSVKPIKRQVAVVVWVVATSENDPPLVIPIKLIRAQAEAGSVLLASFIEDDRRDAPSATSMLYWLETTSQPLADTKTGMLARYMLFTNGITPSEEKLLSDPSGWQVKNTSDAAKLAWFGDYMKGGFYFFDGALNFVAIWPQVAQVGSPAEPNNLNTQAYMRIITLQPPPPAPPPKPEGMKGVRRAAGPSIGPGGKS